MQYATALLGVRTLLVFVCAIITPPSFAASIPLTAYFGVPVYPVPGSTLATVTPEFAGFPPAVRVIGGAANPPPTLTSKGAFEDVYRIIDVGVTSDPYFGLYFISQYLPLKGAAGVCSNSAYVIQPPYVSNRLVDYSSAYNDCTNNGSGEPLNVWLFRDRFVAKSPVRRRAIDGSEYEAAPFVIEREGLPWITYFSGYRMGVVASESNWIAGSEAQSTSFLSTNNPPATTRIMWPTFPDPRSNFELVKLPPPFVEGEVFEYVYRNEDGTNPFNFPYRNYFFYSASTAEQSLLEASKNWRRTGYSFKQGGYVSVCRLFGGASRKAHVFSADASECARLRASPDYADEGLPFRASRPIPASANNPTATCPVGTTPLYRALDLRGGNSRYSTSRLLHERLVTVDIWQDQGVAMCVPS
jgi:hypothetical protein